MSKLAFIFPGQGAQKAGMGKDFYEKSEAARSFFDQAQKILDFDLKEMCFGEHEELNLTEYTQPCMVSVCLAIVQELKKRGINPKTAAIAPSPVGTVLCIKIPLRRTNFIASSSFMPSAAATAAYSPRLKPAVMSGLMPRFFSSCT